jgi:hypothetical protein
MAESALSSILKYGLLAGGAYYLYNAFLAPAAPVVLGAPATATGSLSLNDLQTALSNTAATPAPPVPAPPPSASQSAIKSLILAKSAGDPAIAADGTAAIDVWNFYRNLVATPLTQAQMDQSFPALTPTDRGQPITIDQYLAQVAAATGISGLGALSVPVPIVVRTADGRRVMVWAARDLPGGDVAVFGAAHPFRLKGRPLPAANWKRA